MPMSPRLKAPSTASETAWHNTSASEWPNSPFGEGISTPPNTHLRPDTSGCTSNPKPVTGMATSYCRLNRLSPLGRLYLNPPGILLPAVSGRPVFSACSPCPSSTIDNTARSSGKVTLRLRRSPRTTATLCPYRSTSWPSSVPRNPSLLAISWHCLNKPNLKTWGVCIITTPSRDKVLCTNHKSSRWDGITALTVSVMLIPHTAAKCSLAASYTRNARSLEKSGRAAS